MAIEAPQTLVGPVRDLGVRGGRYVANAAALLCPRLDDERRLQGDYQHH
jgi:hypothetical protein